MNQATTICPLCDSRSDYKFTSKHGREVFFCSNLECRHLFTPPLTTNQGVHDRPIDIEGESDKSLQLYGERNERLLRLFLSSLTTKKRDSKYLFLDFGAGDAHISRSFKTALKDGVDIYCVEEEEKCKALYSKYDLTHISALEDIPEQADLIYAIEVIEHVVDPITVLKRMRNVLSNDGKIFLSTPPGHVSEKRTSAYDNPTHLHFFTPLSLNLALSKAGLEPIKYRLFPELQTQQTWKWKARSKIRSIYNCFSTMGMPASSDGTIYPYHLTGFSQSSV